MTKNRLRLRASCAFAGMALAMTLVLSGCSTDAPKMSEQEKADFKGGPMPESARVEMAKRMEAANKQK